MTDGTPVNLSAALPFMAGRGVDPTFSQWQLSPTDVMLQIEHFLKGEIWKPGQTEEDEGTWVKPDNVKPMLNDAGVQAILQKVASMVNRIVIMSNLDDKAVNSWLWDLGHELAAELVSRMWPENDWKIDFRNLDVIHDMVMLMVEASLKRALLDGERKKLYEAQSIQETRIDDRSTGKGGGFLSWVPGMGGGAK